MTRRIAALVPYLPGAAPGQRVRIETWAPYLREQGWTVDLYPFEDAGLHNILYRPGHAIRKSAQMAACCARHLRRILALPAYDILFVYREAALVGPPILEWLASRKGGPVVYDIDDPTFLAYRSPLNGWYSLLKYPRKTESLLRRADHVITINSLIGTYAAEYNSTVTVIPNGVDVHHYLPREPARNGPPRVVWIGSQSTIQNLHEIARPLARLQRDLELEVRVIGAHNGSVPGVRVDGRTWTTQTEVSDLQDCDIGLVPLAPTKWNEWKFFYKTVQYMAVGMPVVAHRMGSNTEVIEDGVNGFLVDTTDDWYRCLRLLIEEPELRLKMGVAARASVVERYSNDDQISKVITVFETVRLLSNSANSQTPEQL